MNGKQHFEKYAPYYVCLHIHCKGAENPHSVVVRHKKDAEDRMRSDDSIIILGEHHSRKLCELALETTTVHGVRAGERVNAALVEAQKCGSTAWVYRAITALKEHVARVIANFPVENGVIYENVFEESKILHVSTTHVTQEDMNLLAEYRAKFAFGNPSMLIPNPIVAFPYPEGAFVCTGEKTVFGSPAQKEYIDELGNYGYSKYITGIMVAAANTGYRFIRFDRDEKPADAVPDLYQE